MMHSADRLLYQTGPNLSSSAVSASRSEKPCQVASLSSGILWFIWLQLRLLSALAFLIHQRSWEKTQTETHEISHRSISCHPGRFDAPASHLTFAEIGSDSPLPRTMSQTDGGAATMGFSLCRFLALRRHLQRCQQGRGPSPDKSHWPSCPRHHAGCCHGADRWFSQVGDLSPPSELARLPLPVFCFCLWVAIE